MRKIYSQTEWESEKEGERSAQKRELIPHSSGNTKAARGAQLHVDSDICAGNRRRIVSGRTPDSSLFHKQNQRDKQVSDRRDKRSSNKNGINAGRDHAFALKPHQLEAVEFFLNSGLNYRLLGDEMRVGKTPTAIELDKRLRERVDRKQRGNNCTLIVCPKSVIDVWSRHLSLLGVPQQQIVAVDLPAKKRIKESLGRIAAAKRKSTAKALYVIINWDSVQTIRSELQRAGPWFHIIGDEIHRIKGRSTKRTEAFKRLKAKQKTGLSGTPADNRPEDFWSVLHWLQPQDYSSYWSFVDKYCNVRVTRTGFKQILGVNYETVDELRNQISRFYLRRKLSEVAQYLPQKQYRTVRVQMGKRQRTIYDRFDLDDIVGIEGGDLVAAYDIDKLVRLQQLAIGTCSIDEQSGRVSIGDSPPSPKLNMMMELIEDAGSEQGTGPWIIFAQFRDTINLAAKRLRSAGYSVATISGLSSSEERASEVRRFQEGSADVFLGTIGVCREGITLSRANSIIFIDRAWNPNWNRQAEARADALDSTMPVSIIYLMCEDSIDEARTLRIDEKGRDTDAVIRAVKPKKKLPGKKIS